MIYVVNENRKKEILSEIKQKRKDKVAIPYAVFNVGKIICSLIFIVPTIISVFLLVRDVLEGHIEAAIFYGVAIVLLFALALALAIIPAAFRSVADRKYLMPWVAVKKKEQVILSDKAVEHGFYNKFFGEYYYTFKVRYDEVVRMEYDEEQCLLRVYGPKEERWWTNADKAVCHDKFSRDVKGKDSTWLEIPTYFEGFEGLKAELAEKTGKLIENKVRPFLVYK